MEFSDAKIFLIIIIVLINGVQCILERDPILRQTLLKQDPGATGATNGTIPGSPNNNLYTILGLSPLPEVVLGLPLAGSLTGVTGMGQLPSLPGIPGLGQIPIGGGSLITPLVDAIATLSNGTNDPLGAFLGSTGNEVMAGLSLIPGLSGIATLLGGGNHASTGNNTNEDIFLTFPQLATKYGYPIETHNITTKDGYILTAWRIPFSHKKSQGPSPNPRTLLLGHGLTASADCWIISPPAKNLAFTLVDAGYDIWALNFRGSGASLNHTYLLSNQTDFWDFSLDQLGRFDLPAAIDYILNETGQPDLYYIGHSMGATALMISLSLHPQYNDKIKVAVLWAPAVFMTNAQGPLRVLSSLVAGGVSPLLIQALSFNNTIGMFGLNDLDAAVARVAACGVLMQELCAEGIFTLFGFDPPQLNLTQLPVFAGHVPSTTSTYTGIHYAQLINSGRFANYDYGMDNLSKYGLYQPPAYDLSRVNVPLAIKYGQNDFLATPADVLHLAKMLPNVFETVKVDFDAWNHLDFVIGIDALDLVVYPTIEILDRF